LSSDDSSDDRSDDRSDDVRAGEEALGSSFYDAHPDADLVTNLRLALREESARRELEEATGIGDREVLAKLAGLGIRADTLAALTLIPLIQVAWADGVMDEKEREAILAGAVSTGIPVGSPSHTLLRIWVEDRPPVDMQKAWADFITALRSQLDGGESARLGEKILSRARSVAEAAGDLLGHGSMVSPEEEAVLRQLGAAFD